MHKVLAAAAVLGLLGLPILASAQSPNQPSAKKETAAKPDTSGKKAAQASASKKAGSKGMNRQQAQVTNKRRLAAHGHKMRHARGNHGKRFAKVHIRPRHASGFRTVTRLHRAPGKPGTANARAVTDGRTTIQRRAAYRAEAPMQRSCGQFMYRKDGKCNDARNKPAK